MKLTIRRRGLLMAAVTLTALGLSAGYLWRFGQTRDEIALIIAVGLGLLAVIHAVAWIGARRPLLVADDTGLLVRWGGGWSGVPWPSVERVEVRNRGRLSDGRVTVVSSRMAEMPRTSSWRARVATLVARRVYDGALIVPFGLSTTVSEPDLVAALRRLADGRAPVDIPGGLTTETAPTVAPVDTPGDLRTEPTPTVATEPPTSHPAFAPALVPPAPLRTESPAVAAGPIAPAPPTPPTREAELQPSASVSMTNKLAPRPRRRLRAVVAGAPKAPLTHAVSALVSRPAARREEVIAGRSHGTDGALALAPRAEPDALPEMRALRRSPQARRATDTNADAGADLDRGNVALIIDATTDLSARAMQKVRRPVPTSEPVPLLPPDPAAEAPRPDLIIGGEVAEARERLRLSVDELADRTRIRPFVIESIEADYFAPCGGDFYARGHLRMLARVLGIDGDPLVSSYDEHFATSPIRARDVFEVELANGTKGMVRGGDSRANWGALIGAVLVLAMLWGLASYFTEQGGAAADEGQPDQNAAGLGSPGVGNAPAPPPRIARVTVSARVADARVVVTDRFGRVVFRGLLPEGSSKQLQGEAPLRVAAADGGVTALSYGGQPQGLMGDPGERARQVIRAQASGEGRTPAQIAERAQGQLRD